MNGLRAKIALKTEAGLTRVTIAWVNVVDSVPGETQFKEEFQISAAREGCEYVSRVVVTEGTAVPSSFFIDENGLRHFTLDAEAAKISASGQDLSG